jgi:hypothetical protein
MRQPRVIVFGLALLLALLGCERNSQRAALTADVQASPRREGAKANAPNQEAGQKTGRLIHVLVALCDNQYQGIVPVPAKIGNGDDPASNLYWGAAYGVKSFFKKAKDWRQIADLPGPKPEILERVVFKHQSQEVYLIADAYRGREIKVCTADFFNFAAGRKAELITLQATSNKLTLHAGGKADLIAYVGHDGLMDFTLAEYPRRVNDRPRDAIILACASKQYFAEPLRQTGANPLLWTTGLMAPEAYALKAALDGWMLKEDGDTIRRRAAEAYNQYQKCGMRAALNLFSSGW